MFRTNFNSTAYSTSKPKDSLSDRKNELHPYIHYNSSGNNKQQYHQNNKFFQNSKPRDLSHTRNNSDYQLNTINSKASQPSHSTANKENCGNHNQNYQQKNYYNQNPAPLTLQLLNQKIHYLKDKVRRNQEKINQLSLIPLGALDDLNSSKSSKNRQSRGNSSYQNNLQIRELVKSIDQLKSENNKQSQRYQLNISSMNKIISQIKEQIKSEPKINQKTVSLNKQNNNGFENQSRFKIESMEFEIKDIHNRFKIQLAKNNQETIEKFIEVTKSQIQNIRNQFGERIKIIIEDNKSSDRGKHEKKLFKNSIIKTDQKIQNKNYLETLTPSNKIFTEKPITFVIQQHIRHLKTPLISSHILSVSGSSNILNLNTSKFDSITENSMEQNSSSIKISETIYHIDNQGYLLDQNQKYLLTSEKNQIMLSKRQIQVLKELKILR